MFEIHDRSPVVRFVFFKPTSSTGSNSCDIFLWIHGQVEAKHLIRSNREHLILMLTHSIRDNRRRYNVQNGFYRFECTVTYPSNNLMHMSGDLARSNQTIIWHSDTE